jgi:CheY-like chemotaxis protein
LDVGCRPAILIVEDEDGLREALAFDFSRKGYKIFEASGGNSALKILAQNQIDIILSDVNMPDGSGIELLDALKSWPSTPPSVILMTGFADISIAEAYQKGAEIVFPKPFDRKALHGAVEDLLNQAKTFMTASSKRWPCTLPIEITTSEGVTVKGTCLNASQRGLFIALDHELPMELSRLSFSVWISGAPEVGVLKGTCMVRWRNTNKCETLPAGVGVEFENREGLSEKIMNVLNFLKTSNHPGV